VNTTFKKNKFMEWHDFNQTRQNFTKTGLYWWRVPAVERGGVIFRPEFVDELTPCGVGTEKGELWPCFSYWDGWRRAVPAGTEWAEVEEDTAKNAVNYGWILDDCPFCGSKPKIEYKREWIGARPHTAWGLTMKCCIVDMGLYWTDFAAMIKRWNTRKGK
jgi:hypothetical protein